MNYPQKFVRKINKYQQKHQVISFIVAVIKKYNDDSAGRQAALLTYYGFLSLFPLLLILTTVADALASRGGHLREIIVNGLTNYFPLLGNELASQVHRLDAHSLAVLAGLVFTFYGTRGVASAFTTCVQDMWFIPKSERTGFPKSIIKNFVLIVVGGCLFIAASILSSITSAAGHNFIFRVLSSCLNVVILMVLFSFLLNFSLPRHVSLKETRLGAIFAAVSLFILQSLGGYILSHELKHLDALYSYFTIALGILFWIYLQTKVLYYSIEISIVSSQKLWPRSLESDYPTFVDHKLAHQVR